jgi:hypothetical protein
MNGRVYDPVLGRFLSADPHVDEPDDSQAFNRYSYVSNNPMNATDPSGYFKLKDALKIVAIVAVAVVGAAFAAWAIGGFANGLVGFGNIIAATANGSMVAGFAGAQGGGWAIAAMGAGGGFASGFAGSLLNGGSIGDAFKAGIIGGITGAIAAGVGHMIGDFAQANGWFEGTLQHASHGALQGGIAEATGGEFRHGFYAGFASSSLGGPVGSLAGGSRTGNMIAGAIVGGTASALGGGKFANGAVSGAFTYMFNHNAHPDNRDWLDRASDFAAGFGDTVTFGVSRYLRDKVFTNFYEGTVNYDSTSYTAGEVTAVATTTVVGGVQGLRSAGSMAGKAGAEFSHWIPARMGGARSLFNGNFVSKATHALSDPYRYRFMPRAWKLANPMPNVLSQQLTRLPMVYTYGAAGAATGGAGVASNHLLFGN